MSIFNSAYNDVINGKDPQTFGLSGDDAIKYLKNYYAAKLGYEYGKMIGDGVAKVGIAFFDLFFYRMAYIFPGLIIFLLIFDYDTWIRINDIPYFIKYKLMDVMLVILLQIVFVVIPICLITYTLYMYLRGLELGNYILQKSVKQKLLFYGIGFYTIGISCIGIYMLFSIFVSDLFALFSKEFLWIKYLFFIYISWKLINSLINFHWSEYKVLKWSTESTFFKKGMNRALENNAKNLNLDQIQKIDIKD